MTISLHALRFQRAAAVAVLAAMSVPSLFAARPMHWEELPAYLQGKYVTAVMQDGKAHRGLFVETQSGSLVLKGSTRMELPRNAVSMLRVEQPTQGNVQNANRIL